MKRYCSKCSKLHDHDHNCTVGKFDRYYRDDEVYKLRNSRKWWATRDETLERDRHLCVACRMIDSYLNSRRLEVHHIIDIKDCIATNRVELVYATGNCITLCQHHHRQAHKGELPLLKILEKLPWYSEPEDTPPTL